MPDIRKEDAEAIRAAFGEQPQQQPASNPFQALLDLFAGPSIDQSVTEALKRKQGK